MNNVVEASLMAQTVAETRAPSLGDDGAGVHVPRHQGRAELRVRVPGTNLVSGLIYEHGLQAGSHVLAKGSPEPAGDAVGAGFSLYYSVPMPDPRWFIGVGTEILLYAIPFVEYRICEDFCPGPVVVEDQDTAVRFVGSLSVTPSYRLDDNWAFFGGLSMRNHPTVPRVGIEGSIDLGGEVRAGPANIVVTGGVEYIHPSGVRVSLHLYQTVTNDPVQYYPTVGLAIALPLLHEIAPAQPPLQAPAYGAAPGSQP
jgi:hypothetical protein